MMSRGLGPSSETRNLRGVLTLTEIRQQPELWPATLECVAACSLKSVVRERAAIICGAGTSGLCGVSGGSRLDKCLGDPNHRSPSLFKAGTSAPGTRFCCQWHTCFLGTFPVTALKSTGVIARIQKMFPDARHLAITSNQNGQLARLPRVKSIVLDPRTNDRSLAMTSSFSKPCFGGTGNCRGRGFWRNSCRTS